MLTRLHRFHGHNSLRAVYQKGRPLYSASFKLLYAPAQKKTYRVAVVVSKKVHKSAIVRNRIRRRTFEYVRTYLPQQNNLPDLVFIVQTPNVATLPAGTLANELDSLLKKALSSI